MAAAVMKEDGVIQDKLEWVDALEISDIVVGETKRVLVTGLDICIACAQDGQVYALGNKSMPLGVPSTDGRVVDFGVS